MDEYSDELAELFAEFITHLELSTDYFSGISLPEMAQMSDELCRQFMYANNSLEPKIDYLMYKRLDDRLMVDVYHDGRDTPRPLVVDLNG
jgi:methionyl-tRNA synthetase